MPSRIAQLERLLVDTEDDARVAFRHMCNLAPASGPYEYWQACQAWQELHDRAARLADAIAHLRVRMLRVVLDSEKGSDDICVR
jgi:hypothetical protein